MAQRFAIRPARALVAMGVALGHLFLLWALQPAARTRWPAGAEQPASTWVLIEAIGDTASIANTPVAPVAAAGLATRNAPAAIQPAPARGDDTPTPTAIDWHAQGQSVARQTAEQLHRAAPRGFGTQPRSPYRACKPRKSSWEWKPEPDKVGMAGPLPYVRLGKRCVVGLGFFGCALGELPPANGKLLDDLREPDRPTSSVPGPEHCEDTEAGDTANSENPAP